jgi:hypothetical protein
LPSALSALPTAVPWLAAALSVGTLAVRSLAGIGHVAGIAGLVASALVVAGLSAAHDRPARGRRDHRCRAPRWFGGDER